MSVSRALAVCLALVGSAHGEPLLQGGAYEVTARLELPHLERWAIPRTTAICLSGESAGGALPIPVLSGNNPFAGCSARNVERDAASLRYDIVCPGRDAARASAAYTLAPGRFVGRIAMVMGAKNMTMTEVQSGLRIAGCDVAAMRAD